MHQFLLRSGKTSFLGMAFGDLRRMALDIEVTTAPGFEFPNAARESDRIIAIAMADSTGFSTVLSGAELSEAQLLAECSRILRERDPDVLEGHNIFRFDLEYLEARARRHRVPLAWGRDGSVLRGYPSRMQVAERAIGYRRYGVIGRHIVDTWILAQLYDVGARDLESYGLKDVARHFGVAAPDRTYLPPEDIPRIFVEDPARLMAYARDDVLETLAISAILSPPYFVQAQALPFDYQTTVLRGNATKIDALLMREYLHRRQAVPAPGQGRGVAGGYTAVFQQGVARDVLHVDVTSLYPSLMLGQDLFPASDRLGVSASLLRDLREFRVSAKRLARDAAAPEDRIFLNALQQTFKIFINSFYGYLAFSQGHWNDFDVANRVTGEGRRLVQALLDRLGELGATVIEVDTDGIYFVPPASDASRAAAVSEEHLVSELSAVLPEGIQLELDGRYVAMLSYKMKNYVVLDERGKLLIKGSGLRSRGIELFQRLWMEEMFRLLLTGRRDEIPALAHRWEEDFRAHRVPLKQFMKTETLQESLGAYRQKLQAGARNVGAAYELAQGSSRIVPAGRSGLLLCDGRFEAGHGQRGGQARGRVEPGRARREHRVLRGQAAGALREVPAADRAGRPLARRGGRARARARRPRAGQPVRLSAPSPDERELARPRGRLRAHSIVPGAGREANLRGEPRHAALDVLAVGARGIAGRPDRARGSARAPTEPPAPRTRGRSATSSRFAGRAPARSPRARPPRGRRRAARAGPRRRRSAGAAPA